MTRTTIRSEDITAGQVKSADLASDAVDTTGLETDIALLGFKVAANGSMAAYNLKDQTVDAFEDATGVDASGSTDESRNASNYYSGKGITTTSITSASSLWSGNTGDVTFSGSGITVNTGDKQLYVTNSISGDFDVNITLTNITANGSAFGIFRDDETITGNNDFNNMTNIWYWDQPNQGSGSSNVFAFGQTSQGSYTYSNGDVLQIQRRSGVIKFYDDAVLAHTFTQENSGDMKIIIGWSGVTGMNYTNISWDQYTDVYNNMTLISNSTTAEATPTTGDLVMTYTNGAGTATVNTDLKAYVSRDNGTTYTQATLSSQGTTGGHTILTAHNVDISSQPSGTSMRYKITTHNQSASKETRIQAVSLGWA